MGATSKINRSAQGGARSSLHYGGEGVLIHPPHQGVCGRHGTEEQCVTLGGLAESPGGTGVSRPISESEVASDALPVDGRLCSTTSAVKSRLPPSPTDLHKHVVAADIFTGHANNVDLAPFLSPRHPALRRTSPGTENGSWLPDSNTSALPVHPDRHAGAPSIYWPVPFLGGLRVPPRPQNEARTISRTMSRIPAGFFTTCANERRFRLCCQRVRLYYTVDLQKSRPTPAGDIIH